MSCFEALPVFEHGQLAGNEVVCRIRPRFGLFCSTQAEVVAELPTVLSTHVSGRAAATAGASAYAGDRSWQGVGSLTTRATA